MASVFASARTSTVSILDTVGNLADLISQPLATASRAIDMLDLKVADMHHRALGDSAINREDADMRLIEEKAAEHVEFLQDIYRRTKPNYAFDTEAAYDVAKQRFTEILTKTRAQK